jgi:hypothetical protein
MILDENEARNLAKLNMQKKQVTNSSECYMNEIKRNFPFFPGP